MRPGVRAAARYGPQGVIGRVQGVVDHQGVIPACFKHFLAGVGQAALDGGFVVQAASAQAAFQLGHARRQDKDKGRLLKRQPELGRALHVNVKKHILALVQHLFDRRQRRAVKIAVHLGPFGESLFRAAAFKFFPAQKKIVLAVLFALARLARGAGHGIAEMGKFRQKPLDQRCFARPGRGAQNQGYAFAPHHSPSSCVKRWRMVSG